jgi:hypothetical protein
MCMAMNHPASGNGVVAGRNPRYDGHLMAAAPGIFGRAGRKAMIGMIPSTQVATAGPPLGGHG